MMDNIQHPLLPGLLPMEPVAHARRGDPESSFESAMSISDLTGKQQIVLEILRGGGPMCDEQIYDALWDAGYRMSPSGARTRRAELVNRGLVRFSGKHCILKSKRRSRIWSSVN